MPSAKCERRSRRASTGRRPDGLSDSFRIQNLKLLVVGNGGREHALLWKLRQDAPSAELYITRGNGGTDSLATHLPLDPSDSPALAGWARANDVALTIVGPEAPLAAGMV